MSKNVKIVQIKGDFKKITYTSNQGEKNVVITDNRETIRNAYKKIESHGENIHN